MVVQVFMSHTKLDKNFCDRFDSRAAARVNIKVFRSEFEKIEAPAWQTIKTEMMNSKVMFLLVGNELVKSQEQAEECEEARQKWKFTQNWISYEVGLASQLGIDVWVLCDNVKINFPVPYLNNYAINGIPDKEGRAWIREILENYSNGISYPLGVFNKRFDFTCPHERCQARFNLWSSISNGDVLTCPTCLGDIKVKEKWPRALPAIYIINPNKGPVGTEVLITTAGHTSGSIVEIFFDYVKPQSLLFAMTAGADGNCVCKILIPQAEKGIHHIWVHDEDTGRSETLPFEVL